MIAKRMRAGFLALMMLLVPGESAVLAAAPVAGSPSYARVTLTGPGSTGDASGFTSTLNGKSMLISSMQGIIQALGADFDANGRLRVGVTGPVSGTVTGDVSGAQVLPAGGAAATTPAAIAGLAAGAMPKSLLGSANGVAGLGPDGFVPVAQLPFGTTKGTIGDGGVLAAALPAASLPSAAFRGSFEDASRALADRVSDHLNVKAFGAKGDGTTDDTLAFQNAAAVATGHIPTHIGVGLSTYLNTLVKFLGVGMFANGAVEIDIPAGHYILNAPIAVAYQINSAIHWRGDGSSMTELQFNGGTDGLVTTYASSGAAPMNAMERTGNWNGQAIEVTGLHFISNTGIVPTPAYGGNNIGQGQGEAGAAIKTLAVTAQGASTPPMQVYDDLAFTNAKGWTDGANNWKYGLYLQDPDSLFVNRLFWSDRSLGSNVTSVVIYVHSTSTASLTNPGPGHEFLNFDNIDVLGANIALQMDGNDIQGVNVTHLTTAFVQQGIVWLPPAQSLSGSLTIADSSIGAAYSMVHLANASTVYSHDNFYYNVSPPTGTNPIFFYVIGGDTVISHHDQFYGPLPGYEGAGYSSTAMFVSGFPSADVAPGHISDDTVSHFDNGLLFGGGSTINFTNDVVSSDTTRCYGDTSAATATNLRGQFDGIYCGGTVNAHDGIGLPSVYDWAPQRFMNGGLELGLPGVASPAGVPGGSGLIDFHSQPNKAGTLASLNDYEVRLIASGGTDGANGQGTLNLYGTGGLALKNGGLVSAGPIVDQSGTHAYVSATGGGFTAVGRRVMIQCAHPTDTYAALTVTLPQATMDQQPFSLSASCTISRVTLVPFTGQTSYLAGAALAPGQMINLIYDLNTGPLAAPGWE